MQPAPPTTATPSSTVARDPWPSRDAILGDPEVSRWIYRAIVRWGSMLVRNYYRVEVRGEPFPKDAPVLLVQNHTNGLCDAHTLMAATPRPIRILVKFKLLKAPVIGWMLRQMEAVPMYRRKDGVDTRQNAKSFEAIDQALVDRSVIALFPEGESLNSIGLRELRSGVARMAISAEKAVRKGASSAGQDPSAGPSRGLLIVPIGVTFERRDRYRTRVSALIGEPIVVADVLARVDAADQRAAISALLAATGDSIRKLILHARDAEEHEAAVALARLAPRDERPLGIRRQDALARLATDRSDGHERRADLVTQLGARLEALRLEGDDVLGPPPPASRLVRPALLDLPLFAVSVIAWGVPVALALYFARFRKTPDKLVTLRALFTNAGFLVWFPVLAFLGLWLGGISGIAAVAALFAITIPTFRGTVDRLMEARRILALRALHRRSEEHRQLVDGLLSIRRSYGFDDRGGATLGGSGTG